MIYNFQYKLILKLCMKQNLPKHIVLQKDFHSISERSAVILASALHDIQVDRVNYSDLAAIGKDKLPIGSVEFVRRYMQLHGITEPDNLSYPEALKPYFKRRIYQTMAGTLLGTMFVKPVKTKQFSGFVFDTMSSEMDYPVDVVKDYQAFMALPPYELVYVSEVVKFVAEFRCYVSHDEYLGKARYDAGNLEDVDIDEDVIKEMIHLSGIRHGAVDVGVLDNGEVCLVECNDAWALGLYGKSITSTDYISMLWGRWEELST